MNFYKTFFTFFFLFQSSLLFALDSNIDLTVQEKDFLAKHKTVKVSNVLDWAPYDYNINGIPKGYSVDYMKLLADKLGIELEFVPTTWENSLENLKNKKIDMIHTISKSDKKRLEYTLFTKPYLNIRYSLITQNNSKIKTLDDLKHKKIALVKGWTSTKFIKENYPNIEVIEKNSSKEILNDVAFGNADAAIDDFITANYFITKELLNNLTIRSSIDIPNSHNILHLGVRDDWGILNEILNKAIASITEDEILSINNKWMLDSFSQIVLEEFTKNEKEFIKTHPVVTVGGEMDWPPFDYVQNGKYQGIAKDYLDLLEKYTGLQFDVKTGYTWNELLQMAQNKQLDMLPMIYFSKDREKFLNFTSNYLNVRNYLYTLKGAQEFSKLDDLNGKTIAVPKGFAQAEIIKKEYPKINILEAKSVLDSIDAVVTKKADAFIENTALVTYLLKKHNIRGIKGAFAIQIGVNELYMAARKDWPVLRDIIQKGLDSITTEERDYINNKWMKISEGKQVIKFSSNEREFIKNNTVKCITTTTWAPFNTHDDSNTKPVGVALDYWEIITQNTGLKTECKIANSWEDVLSAIKNKEADITLSTTITKDREDYGLFSKPYASFPIAIATQNDKGYISDGSYLEGKKVAVGKGYTAHKLLKEYYPEINFVPVKGVDKALELLSKGKVDAVVDILPVLAYKMNIFGYSNLKISGTTKLNFDVRMMIANDKKELVSIVNKGIDTISNDEKKLIYNKWISIKLDKGFDYSLFWKIILVFLVIVLFVVYKNRQLVKYQKVIENKNNELELKNKDLKEAEDNMLETLNSFQMMINSTLEGIFILQDNVCIDVNDVAVELLGYDNKEQMIGKNAFEFISIESKEIVKEKIALSEAKPYEVKVMKKDGTVMDSLLRGKNLVLNGKHIRISALLDMSELKEKEQIILEQSKMAALGEMIGNIAHQWRQPLSVISSGATGIKVQNEFGHLTYDFIDETCDLINSNAQYLSKTIDDFRDFIKGDRKKELFNLKENINSFINLVEGSIKGNYLELISDIEDDTMINGYPNELIQCFINIFNNSKDVLNDIDQDNRFIFISSFVENNKAVIVFKDNAGGIPDNVLPNIFEPYFTTKHKSKGTGLGLHMTYNLIVDGMKGTIQAKNESYEYKGKNYKGAVFKIILPLS